MAGSMGRATRRRCATALAERGSTTDHPAPPATRLRVLAQSSASTTGSHSAPALAKASATRGGSLQRSASATAGWRDKAWGESIGGQAKACVAGQDRDTAFGDADIIVFAR